jgi:thiamine-monophosphate kinase
LLLFHNFINFHSAVIPGLKATPSRVGLGIVIWVREEGQMATESEMIAALARIFASADPNLTVGIGDDGAVIKASLANLVAATDMAVEGVHFNRSWSTLHQIGAKLAAANLADIVAMGAKPKYLLVSAGLSADFDLAKITELAQGIKAEADLLGVSVIGGDISKSGELVISITALGEVQSPIKRDGAQVDDLVILSNLTGVSAAGLSQLHAGTSTSPFIDQHKKPVLEYKLGAEFALSATRVNSMSDVSDGLLISLEDIASAARIGIEIDPSNFESAPGFTELSECARTRGVDVFEWILTGGEDHAFVATTSNPIPVGAILIGKVKAGAGVKVVGLDQEAPWLQKPGFKHNF